MSHPIETIIRMHTAAMVCAERRLCLTYGEIAGYIGRPGEQRLLDSDLGLWAEWLRSKDLPPLYVIIINKESGTPGGKCDVPPEEVPAQQARCYRHDWSHAPQPTVQELEALRGSNVVPMK